jgi:hypothetical protein
MRGFGMSLEAVWSHAHVPPPPSFTQISHSQLPPPPLSDSQQHPSRRLFKLKSLRHLAFHSNWFGNFLLWFLFFFLFDRFWFGNLWIWFGKYLELFFAVLEICSYLGICGFDLVKI